MLFGSRLKTALVLVLILFCALASRFYYLQIFRNDYFSGRSDLNRLHTQYVPPSRGLIFDRNAVLLADNKPSFSLTITTELATDIEGSFELLNSILGIGESELTRFWERRARRNIPHSSVPLRFELTGEELAIFAVNQHRLPGFNIEAQFIRNYPLGGIAPHAIGYVSEIDKDELEGFIEAQAVNYGGSHKIGKTGIEKTYEEILHGQVGFEVVEKNNLGRIMRVLDRTEPIADQNIVLYLDSNLQAVAEKALGDYRGAVVAIDPQTGGVLAMISKPDFDPNIFVSGASRSELAQMRNAAYSPEFNRALSSRVPGSTIKPFMSLAGLYYELVTPEHVISDRGFYQSTYRRRPYYDWTWWADKSGHGEINMERSIYQSCNTYFYELADLLGIDRVEEYLATVGFGRNNSIDIPEAGVGILASRAWKLENRGEPWYLGETPFEGIGNGITQTTTLQMASAVAAIANHGKLMHPRLLKGLIDKEGQFHPAVFDRTDDYSTLLATEEHIAFVRNAMVQVVNKPYDPEIRRHEGSAYPHIGNQASTSYIMGGKTGTAQVIEFSVTAGQREDRELPDDLNHHAMFIAFDASPESKIAIAVYVEHGGSGGAVAAPIAQAVMDAYIQSASQLAAAD